MNCKQTRPFRRALAAGAAVVLLALTGCVAYPAYPGYGYYDGGYSYGGPYTYGYAAPSIVVGGVWGGGWGGGWHGGGGHWWR